MAIYPSLPAGFPCRSSLIAQVLPVWSSGATTRDPAGALLPDATLRLASRET